MCMSKGGVCKGFVGWARGFSEMNLTWACGTASGLRSRGGSSTVGTGGPADLNAGAFICLVCDAEFDTLARAITHLAIGVGFTITTGASAWTRTLAI